MLGQGQPLPVVARDGLGQQDRLPLEALEHAGFVSPEGGEPFRVVRTRTAIEGFEERPHCDGPHLIRVVDATVEHGPSFVGIDRSEEHTYELQSLMRISYAVFCLKKKNKRTHIKTL